jgi:hypothetical protein
MTFAFGVVQTEAICAATQVTHMMPMRVSMGSDGRSRNGARR